VWSTISAVLRRFSLRLSGASRILAASRADQDHREGCPWGNQTHSKGKKKMFAERREEGGEWCCHNPKRMQANRRGWGDRKFQKFAEHNEQSLRVRKRFCTAWTVTVVTTVISVTTVSMASRWLCWCLCWWLRWWP
jgi:hypothetical protein